MARPLDRILGCSYKARYVATEQQPDCGGPRLFCRSHVVSLVRGGSAPSALLSTQSVLVGGFCFVCCVVFYSAGLPQARKSAALLCFLTIFLFLFLSSFPPWRGKRSARSVRGEDHGQPRPGSVRDIVARPFAAQITSDRTDIHLTFISRLDRSNSGLPVG